MWQEFGNKEVNGSTNNYGQYVWSVTATVDPIQEQMEKSAGQKGPSPD